MGRKHRRAFVAVGAALVIAFATVTARLFVSPATDAPRKVDAVVLFVGGRGERLALAERLMSEGIAPNLIVPNGLTPEWPQGNRACTETRSYRVLCPRPAPDTTVGEARVIASVAAAESWRSLLVVTSSYQLTRASLLLDRCFVGDVATAQARPRLGPIDWSRRIAHEWPALAHAVIVDRSC